MCVDHQIIGTAREMPALYDRQSLRFEPLQYLCKELVNTSTPKSAPYCQCDLLGSLASLTLSTPIREEGNWHPLSISLRDPYLREDRPQPKWTPSEGLAHRLVWSPTALKRLHLSKKEVTVSLPET